MKDIISFTAQITDMDSGEILSQLRRRVDPNVGVLHSSYEMLERVTNYLKDGKSVSLEINYILSGFSDRNNQQLNIF